MAFDIELIKKDDILKVWGEVAHYAENLERRSHGRYVTADILHQLLELPYFVWIVRENGNALGFFICGVNKYPRKTYLDLNTLSGNRLKEWASEAYDVVEKFAQTLGLDGLETSTAPGMEKAFKRHGFVKEYVVMVKPVERLIGQVEEDDLHEADEPLMEVAYGR